MWYFLWTRNFLIVTSEIGMPKGLPNQDWVTKWKADVLAISPKMISYEIEVKMTLEDLRRDKRKFRKHQEYHSKNYSPHYFYYAIPKGLENKAIIDKPYGIMTVDPKILGNVRVFQKACHLPGTGLPDDFLKHICRRICAENIDLREKIYREKGKMEAYGI